MGGLVPIAFMLWVLGGLILLLHYLSPRLGFAPIFLLISALMVFIQAQLGIMVEPFSGLSMFISSNVLIPVVLMNILILYIVNGAVPARLTIYGMIGVSLLTLALMETLYQLLKLPSFSSFEGGTFDLTSPLNARVTAASLIALIADMFAIAIFYQGAHNLAPRLPIWGAAGLALLAALWTDSILFSIGSDLGTDDFAKYLPGDVLGKTISALILWPPLGYFMARLAPHLPDYQGAKDRPTFDVLFGALDEIKLALRRAEAALEQSEAERRKEAAYFRQIADNVQEALWLFNADERLPIYLNPAYERIWARHAAQLYIDPNAFPDSLHPEDRERILGGLPRIREGHYEVEYRILRPDGTLRWVRDRAFPIKNETGQVYRVAGITEDITERKLLERQQLELMMEREKVTLLRNFISEASHDLRGPLTTINMRVHLLTKTDNPDKRRAYLDEISRLSAHMGDMIDELLLLARLEHLDQSVYTDVEVNQMIEDICQMVRAQAENKGLELVLDLCSESLPIQADQSDLSRAIRNLIENAVRYTSRGAITIQTEVRPEAMIIRIKDTGIGIPQDDLPHIFNRFYRGSNARTEATTGTGLGLAIAQKVIEQHRGKIEVTSIVGEGTTFMITLPIARPQD
jgi:PAS domain S-box-containing protein